MTSDLTQDLTQAFIVATILTLKVQCKCEVTHTSTESIHENSTSETPFAIGALVGIIGASGRGAAILGFPKEVFLNILTHLMNEPATEISQDNQDAAGELLNIIFAQSKNALNQKGHALQLAIPSILHGTGVDAQFTKHKETRLLKFHMDSGDFFLKFVLDFPDIQEKLETKQSTPLAQQSSPSEAKKEIALQLLESTVLAFKTQFRMDIQPSEPFEKTVYHEYPIEIAAIVAITCSSLTGSFMLVFKQEVFIKLCNRVFKENSETLQNEMADLVAEIANIILGITKKKLNPKGYDIKMAIPTVIHSSKILSNYQKERKSIIIPFMSEVGDFSVELDIQD